MKIDLDKHQILYYLEGCARGSHLRQGCWYDMVQLYPKMDKEYKEYLYEYSKRDIAPIFEPRSYGGKTTERHFGYEEFEQFLACYNPDNRYIVTAEKDGRKETREAYLYNGHYYTDMYTYFDEDYITKITKV